MQEFDRILDRNDVRRGFLVTMIDHCRQRGRLAAARGADHQYQSPAQHGQFFYLLGHTEFLERRQL